MIKGGREVVRHALSMAAVATLTAEDDPFEERYARLQTIGKPPKLALVAVMRAMLCTLNAMLRNKNPWNDRKSIDQPRSPSSPIPHESHE